MSVLVPKVLELGYQYYDWNVSSGDGGTATTEEIIAQSETDKYHQVMLLFHDAATKRQRSRHCRPFWSIIKILAILLKQSTEKAWLCIIR